MTSSMKASASTPQPDSIAWAIQDLRHSGSEAAMARLFEEYYTFIVRSAESHLRTSRGVLTDGDDIASSVLRQLTEGLRNERTWFVEGATDREALFRMLGRMTFLRCRRAVRDEKAGIRSRTVRDADCSADVCESPSESLEDKQVGPVWEFDYKMLISEVEERLLKLASPTNHLQAFRDLMSGLSVKETAAALGISDRSVNRLRQTVGRCIMEMINSGTTT